MMASLQLGFVDPFAAIRQRLAERVNAGLTVKQVADNIGFSRSAVSRFLNDVNYGSQSLADEVQRYLDASPTDQAPVATVVAEDGFVITIDSREIFGICDRAMENRRLAVIVGAPGTGKTSTLDRYLSRTPDVIMIRANNNMSCAGLCIRIGQQLGLDLRNGQSLDFMIDSIVAELKVRPRLVIVDEADYLVTRTSLRKVEILRTIYDEARVGMVICGMPRLMHHLTTGPTLTDNLAQMYSRVAYFRRLLGPSVDEVKAFCRNYDIEPDALQLLCTLARHEERGGFRRLDNLVRNAALLAKGGPVRVRQVKDANSELELSL